MALDPNESQNQPIAKFESMLKTDDIYFFDAEDFEDIIHHYLNNGKISLARSLPMLSVPEESAAEAGIRKFRVKNMILKSQRKNNLLIKLLPEFLNNTSFKSL